MAMPKREQSKNKQTHGLPIHIPSCILDETTSLNREHTVRFVLSNLESCFDGEHLETVYFLLDNIFTMWNLIFVFIQNNTTTTTIDNTVENSFFKLKKVYAPNRTTGINGVHLVDRAINAVDRSFQDIITNFNTEPKQTRGTVCINEINSTHRPETKAILSAIPMQAKDQFNPYFIKQTDNGTTIYIFTNPSKDRYSNFNHALLSKKTRTSKHSELEVIGVSPHLFMGILISIIVQMPLVELNYYKSLITNNHSSNRITQPEMHSSLNNTHGNAVDKMLSDCIRNNFEIFMQQSNTEQKLKLLQFMNSCISSESSTVSSVQQPQQSIVNQYFCTQLPQFQQRQFHQQQSLQRSFTPITIPPFFPPSVPLAQAYTVDNSSVISGGMDTFLVPSVPSVSSDNGVNRHINAFGDNDFEHSLPDYATNSLDESKDSIEANSMDESKDNSSTVDAENIAPVIKENYETFNI